VLSGRNTIKFEGLNTVGLRRRGFSNSDIEILKKAYDYIYNSGLNVSEGIKKVESELSDNNYVGEIISFIRSSKRGIIGK
ncbi:MAG TPA: acyl-[acyl-carrier-protein]--UDP-N-acetylglucosamine O-acyltransferase, partial [Ignavibacteriaceae bacterium]|nr:acyl-[acyl-carrier-protein]--UDP-N-acetylglucosamine O-acyltransferase [Ignavibacteriaceae bacterium]